MKKFIKRSLFTFVIMAFSLVSVNAATEFTYDGWTAGTGYGTKTKVTDYITNLNGELNASAGMYYGPFNKQSTQTLKDGITEETYVDIDFESMSAPEFFEVSLAFNDASKTYLTEAVVMTQMVEEGKVKLTAGWAKDFEAVITEDGIYTYQWQAYIKSDKGYVKFNLLNDGEVIATTGEVEFNTLTDENISVRYLWFCNIQAANGVNVYTRLPKLTIDVKSNNNYVTVKDEESAKKIVEKSARKDMFTRSDVERFDVSISMNVEKMTKEELLDDEEENQLLIDLFEKKIKDAIIVNYFSADFVALVDEEADESSFKFETEILKYSDPVGMKLVIPTDLEKVKDKYERQFKILRIDLSKSVEKLIEYFKENPNANLEELDYSLFYEVEEVETTLSDDEKTLEFDAIGSALYALAYLDTELPPKTGDNITTYVIISTISLLAVALVIVKAKKSFN